MQTCSMWCWATVVSEMEGFYNGDTRCVRDQYSHRPQLIAHPAASPFLQKPRHLTLTVSAAPINLTTPNAPIASQAMF